MQANCGHIDRDGVHHPAVAALKTSVPVDWLAIFAALVAAKEREACAQVCDSFDTGRRLTSDHKAEEMAAAIRARSPQ